MACADVELVDFRAHEIDIDALTWRAGILDGFRLHCLTITVARPRAVQDHAGTQLLWRGMIRLRLPSMSLLCLI